MAARPAHAACSVTAAPSTRGRSSCPAGGRHRAAPRGWVRRAEHAQRAALSGRAPGGGGGRRRRASPRPVPVPFRPAGASPAVSGQWGSGRGRADPARLWPAVLSSVWRSSEDPRLSSSGALGLPFPGGGGRYPLLPRPGEARAVAEHRSPASRSADGPGLEKEQGLATRGVVLLGPDRC